MQMKLIPWSSENMHAYNEQKLVNPDIHSRPVCLHWDSQMKEKHIPEALIHFQLFC